VKEKKKKTPHHHHHHHHSPNHKDNKKLSSSLDPFQASPDGPKLGLSGTNLSGFGDNMSATKKGDDLESGLPPQPPIVDENKMSSGKKQRQSSVKKK
jgi:hypothetical protein